MSEFMPATFALRIELRTADITGKEMEFVPLLEPFLDLIEYGIGRQEILLLPRLSATDGIPLSFVNTVGVIVQRIIAKALNADECLPKT